MSIIVISGGVVAYCFVGLVTGMSAYRSTKRKKKPFWDETVAGVLAGSLWPWVIPGIYLWSAAEETSLFLESKEQAWQAHKDEKRKKLAASRKDKQLAEAKVLRE